MTGLLFYPKITVMEPVILDETNDYFVINKPAGIACEPPSHQPTVRDWLIQTKKINPNDWGEADRFGIVHRLDTDTSGVMIWAKTQSAQAQLQSMWQGRAVKKTYLALVAGKTDQTGTIEYALERDNRNDRQRVAHLPGPKSRPAITEYQSLAHSKVGERDVSFVQFHPITGRTHQIRVHAKAIGHPLIADSLYGEKSSLEIAEALGLNRQFLHAFAISLPGEPMFSAPLPDDLRKILEKLQIDSTLYTEAKIG